MVSSLAAVYTSDQPPDLSARGIPDIRIFRLCVVFGVVSGLEGRRQNTFPFDLAAIQSLAMTHAPAIFQFDENVSHQVSSR